MSQQRFPPTGKLDSIRCRAREILNIERFRYSLENLEQVCKDRGIHYNVSTTKRNLQDALRDLLKSKVLNAWETRRAERMLQEIVEETKRNQARQHQHQVAANAAKKQRKMAREGQYNQESKDSRPIMVVNNWERFSISGSASAQRFDASNEGGHASGLQTNHDENRRRPPGSVHATRDQEGRDANEDNAAVQPNRAHPLDEPASAVNHGEAPAFSNGGGTMAATPPRAAPPSTTPEPRAPLADLPANQHAPVDVHSKRPQTATEAAAERAVAASIQRLEKVEQEVEQLRQQVMRVARERPLALRAAAAAHKEARLRRDQAHEAFTAAWEAQERQQCGTSAASAASTAPTFSAPPPPTSLCGAPGPVAGGPVLSNESAVSKGVGAHADDDAAGQGLPSLAAVRTPGPLRETPPHGLPPKAPAMPTALKGTPSTRQTPSTPALRTAEPFAPRNLSDADVERPPHMNKLESPTLRPQTNGPPTNGPPLMQNFLSVDAQPKTSSPHGQSESGLFFSEQITSSGGLARVPAAQADDCFQVPPDDTKQTSLPKKQRTSPLDAEPQPNRPRKHSESGPPFSAQFVSSGGLAWEISTQANVSVAVRPGGAKRTNTGETGGNAASVSGSATPERGVKQRSHVGGRKADERSGGASRKRPWDTINWRYLEDEELEEGEIRPDEDDKEEMFTAAFGWESGTSIGYQVAPPSEAPPTGDVNCGVITSAFVVPGSIPSGGFTPDMLSPPHGEVPALELESSLKDWGRWIGFPPGEKKDTTVEAEAVEPTLLAPFDGSRTFDIEEYEDDEMLFDYADAPEEQVPADEPLFGATQPLALGLQAAAATDWEPMDVVAREDCGLVAAAGGAVVKMIEATEGPTWQGRRSKAIGSLAWR